MAELSDQELLAALGVETEPKKVITRSPREERIIAGFEEVQRFVEEHGSAPNHGEDRDIFEQLYAVRLDRLRGLDECKKLLEVIDTHGLLSGDAMVIPSVPDDIDDDALLAELGIATDTTAITDLRHVRSIAEKRAAEEIANRERCEDFEQFKSLFDQVQHEVSTGLRETRPFKDDAKIIAGNWFILHGQKVYVAEVEEEFINDRGRTDRRLRVIFDNSTESNMLMRSLERALQKDKIGRRITDPTAGPLFADHTADGDEASGTIYVLRSKSQHPVVVENHDILHKIGVTGGKVKRRIANAKIDPTFLMADVEVVATYELFNINRSKLENLIHRVFENSRLDIEIPDRFGRPVVPREWFLVPLFIINEVVEKIQDGTISSYAYDHQQARLKRIS